jgi:hypothetical protein
MGARASHAKRPYRRERQFVANHEFRHRNISTSHRIACKIIHRHGHLWLAFRLRHATGGRRAAGVSKRGADVPASAAFRQSDAPSSPSWSARQGGGKPALVVHQMEQHQSANGKGRCRLRFVGEAKDGKPLFHVIAAMSKRCWCEACITRSAAQRPALRQMGHQANHLGIQKSRRSPSRVASTAASVGHRSFAR